MILSSSSTVTYTSVYTDFEPWRFYWGSDEEPEAPEEAPPSLNCVPGPEHPPSPNYMPGPEQPPSQDYVPGLEEPEQTPLSPDYVPEHEYPEYMVPSDTEEDPEEDPADGGDDDDDELSDDDDDDDDDNDEEQEASKDDDKEEEVHLARADSSVVPALIAEYASAPTPPSPSPLSPLSSLLPQIPSPPLPRALFTNPAFEFEVEESSAAAATRQLVLYVATMDATPRHLVSREVGYGIEYVWDDMVGYIVAPLFVKKTLGHNHGVSSKHS
uniref:Uncharacterized protein n=1 Tax=Tanacetum cinerariifolium TaxID=118510 RepID=A0A6L2LK37_TANCI|nr:hypothetical protein [Tanacetum cinerariifolium]